MSRFLNHYPKWLLCAFIQDLDAIAHFNPLIQFTKYFLLPQVINLSEATSCLFER